MKNLLLILITSCSTYQGIVIDNNEFLNVSRCKVGKTHYVVVSGFYPRQDTLLIDKVTLRVLRKQ